MMVAMTQNLSTGAASAADSKQGARTLAGVYKSAPFHWVGDGFFVSSYFPRPNLPPERVSPFILMDYGPPREFTPLTDGGKRGVGWHPHRGFETVTVAWEGAVAHRDNTGGAGVIGPGDVQWMTAAAGIVHEEYHEAEFTKRGGRMHMMQLWVNLPAKDKMTKPGYQPITASQIPEVPVPGGKGKVRIIAGEHAGVTGPAKTHSPVTLLDVYLKAGDKLPLSMPASHNAMAIVTTGKVRTAGREAVAGELVLYENDGAHAELFASEDAHVLVLGGEPLNEPVVQYGPFVMNTPEEIQKAFFDFQSGRFGPIPD
jgi:redox-sensitive bicupin YhaK (pirin superfamily)